MKVTTLTRSFSYAGVALPDPGPSMTVDQVRDLYTATYPELATATIEGPETRDGKLVYSFRRAVGTKGAGAAATAMPSHCSGMLRDAEKLSERICMACLLPECDEQRMLCLRAYLVSTRTCRENARRVIDAIDLRVNELDCDRECAQLLVEARDTIRQRLGVPREC